jgi:hypothetical protein
VTLFFTFIVTLPVAAVVLGVRVMAIVPTNKSANTATPKIHFQKFGFLVIVGFSFDA